MTELEPDYIVFRDDTKSIFFTQFHGQWFDKSQMVKIISELRMKDFKSGKIFIARPAGRFEVREDGAVAEVWELTNE